MDVTSEQDLDLLETWLDGELPAGEAEALQARLGSEPELAAALAQLRSDREARSAMFTSLAGSSAQAETILTNVKRLASTGERRRWAMRAVRYISAAAACLLVGFAAGWFGRARNVPVAPSAPAQAVYEVGLSDQSGQVAWQKFDSPEKARAFARDLALWQRQQELRNSGQVVLVADRF